MAQDNGILKFDRDEIEEFITGLKELVEDVTDDLDVAKSSKEKAQLSASGYSMDKYGEYTADTTNYKSSIKFYETIIDDLENFLSDVDEQVGFTSDTKFAYDVQMLTDILHLSQETESLKTLHSIDIFNQAYSPYDVFEKVRLVQPSSGEEKLMEFNDANMKVWAENFNDNLEKLVDSIDEVERLHKFFFEDITVNNWNTSHDEYDGLAGEVYKFSHNTFLGNTLRGAGNGLSNLFSDIGSVINIAIHPSKWGATLNSFLHTLGYIATPSNWFNIAQELASEFKNTMKNEGFGYAVGNVIFFAGEEIFTEGLITGVKAADNVTDVAKLVEKDDDVVDVATSVKRIDDVKGTVKKVDNGKGIRVTASDGSVYEYSGRMVNRKYANSVNPNTGIRYDEFGFPIFDSKVTYELPKTEYYSGRNKHNSDLDKQLYNDIETGNIENPFPPGVDYTSLKQGIMPKYYDETREKNINYYTWHHNQEPGVMQLVEFNEHDKSGHTGGNTIWGNKNNEKTKEE